MAKRILVPLDRSDIAETIVPLVADLARGAGATVHLLHVAPIPDNLVSKEGRLIAYADQEMEGLKTQLSPGEANDVWAQLPRDLKELWAAASSSRA